MQQQTSTCRNHVQQFRQAAALCQPLSAHQVETCSTVAAIGHLYGHGQEPRGGGGVGGGQVASTRQASGKDQSSNYQSDDHIVVAREGAQAATHDAADATAEVSELAGQRDDQVTAG